STDPTDKDAWKDKGMGQLSIKCKEGVSKATKESKPTIVVRNDVGKILLNALLYPGIKTNLMKNAIAAIFHTSGDANGNDVGTNGAVVARTYLIKTKTEEDRNKLASAIQEYAPAA
ncbi:Nuclear pore complex protein like, partial [Thalictrum thalictroides]